MKQRVLLKGSDGLDLLHRISTIDLKGDLTRPELQKKRVALILNPQGKIRSAFHIKVHSKDEAEIEFEDTFLDIIDQYTFGESYELQTLPSADAAHEMNEHTRIENLIPRFGKEFLSNEETNPLEVNLRSAISDQKGCYPGQEVIEKIISLGSPPKKLCLFEGTFSAAISCPTPLVGANGAEAGTLTSFEGGVGLGIVKRTFLKENEVLTANGQALTLRKISEI